MHFQKKPAFVFVHGGWVSSSIWRQVMPLIEARGHVARALDLPGSGIHAKAPLSYGTRPVDPRLFSTEPSPNAGVTQEARTAAVVSLIEETARETGGQVVLVGQSLGGLTVTPAVEAIPEALHAVVYISAFLQSPGLSMLALTQHETFKDALVSSLFLADPQLVGACRIDFNSTDAGYRQRMKDTFCHDFSAADFVFPCANCDEPLSVMLETAHPTAERFGKVPRHYVRCLDDRSIPIRGQDFMIATLDSALGGKTDTHTLSSSHWPFFSQPETLTEILLATAT